ncbi:HD domain-containing protein, partial [bacterium]|nr:HD domain-containing protein [bacterium]
MKTSFWQKLSYMSKKDKGFVKKAFLFAQKAHQNQKRTSGELYFNHPLRVAKYLADYKMEKEVIAAGLLHDVCEDTKISLERIKQEFGKEVANLVDGVSVIGRIQTKARLNFAGSENERKNILRLQKLILSSIKDIRVIFIRLLDRKDNLKTLDVFPAEKQKRKAQETLLIYAPLAKKIEMGKLGGELEDMAFKYLYPETYKQVKKVRDKNLPIAHSAIQLLEKTIMKEL